MHSLARTLALGLVLPLSAMAQEFPSRPITLICPWPAGGSTDTHLRRFAEIAAKYVGQPVLIENRPGGGGTIGPGHVAQTAKPDGYMLSQMHMGAFRVPHMQKRPWDPVREVPPSRNGLQLYLRGPRSAPPGATRYEEPARRLQEDARRSRETEGARSTGPGAVVPVERGLHERRPRDFPEGAGPDRAAGAA